MKNLIDDCINSLPRKLIENATPKAFFDAQLDRIYVACITCPKLLLF